MVSPVSRGSTKPTEEPGCNVDIDHKKDFLVRDVPFLSRLGFVNLDGAGPEDGSV